MQRSQPIAAQARRFRLEDGHPFSEKSYMIAEKIPGLKDLSPEEKLILVGELWEELASQPNAFPLREDHVDLLKKRLERYRQDPTDVVAWEDLKAQILKAK